MLLPFLTFVLVHPLSDLFHVVMMERSFRAFLLLLDRPCLYIILGSNGSCDSSMISDFACIALGFDGDGRFWLLLH